MLRKKLLSALTAGTLLLSINMFLPSSGLTNTFIVTAAESRDISLVNPTEETYSLIKGFEGCDKNCFWDNEQWTIGIGNRCPYTHTTSGKKWHEKGPHTITEEYAHTLFFNEMPGYVTRLKSNCKGLTVTQRQFDVLLSGTYNHGNVLPNGCSHCGYTKHPLIQYIYGNYSEVEARERYYVWCINEGTADEPGLRRRRKEEAEWFFSDTRQEPPTYSSLSCNKTNYNLGETVIFTASSDKATGYTIGINKGNERIITQDLNGNTFSFIPSAGGEYSAYVSAWNSAGLKDSAVITFKVYGESPKNPSLTIKDGKTLFAEDETVVFTASATGATGYTIGIDKGGKRIVTQDLNGTTFTFTPQGAGDYYSYVTAWNNAGLTDSKGLTFKVYNSAPTKSEIAIANEKSIYETGSEIAINVTSDTATGYTIGIDRNGERIVTKDFHDSTFKFTPTEPGDYYTYVTSWNKYGIKDSKGISFKVCSTKPTFSELSASTSSVSIGEQIEFSAKSDNANAYWIGIDHNGERYLTEEMKNGTLICTFDDIGDYTAYVTSSNKFGYVDSKLIRFTVCSSISGDCNNDGEFSIADVVELQKWILAVPDTKLKNWKAADLCEDGVINTFDLVKMKQLLVSK